MADKDQDPLDDAPDPDEDTPEDEAEDTAEDDSDNGSTSWEDRYKEAQKAISRQGRELALLRTGAQDSDDEADDADEEPEDAEDDGDDQQYLGKLESESWELVRSTYGEEAVDAYEAFYRTQRRARTPTDFIAALEAYHEVRNGSAAPKKGAPAKDGKPSRADAVRPRVDSNRSDRGPDSDDLIAEARKSGKLEDFAGAAAKALGFGPTGRR